MAGRKKWQGKAMAQFGSELLGTSLGIADLELKKLSAITKRVGFKMLNVPFAEKFQSEADLWIKINGYGGFQANFSAFEASSSWLNAMTCRLKTCSIKGVVTSSSSIQLQSDQAVQAVPNRSIKTGQV
jgi:hypothetical protein